MTLPSPLEMTGVTRNRLAVSVGSLCCLLVAGTAVCAQDTTFREGVRLGLTYSPGSKPGLLVLPANGPQGDSVRAVLERDFDFGDRIALIRLDVSASEATDGARGQFNYPMYAKLGAVGLVQATITSGALHVAVHNVSQKKVERVRDFPLTAAPFSADWRLALHRVADEVELWVTGVRGIAATRILYVSSGRVMQVDSDGANPTALTGAIGAMSPTWHPRGTHLAYTVLTDRGAQVVIREVGGATRTLTSTSTPNHTAVFSPDTYTIAYSHMTDAGTDLYAVNAFGSEPARRVTVGRGSDNMSPTFSPDGRRLAFTSNRTGHPEVYISDADGTNAEILTSDFGDQSYRSNPDWSPDGRLIAFQSQIDGRFQIMTIGLRDRSIKRLTSEGSNEDASWAPDSRHMSFTSNRGGVGQLWILDVESGRVRQLTRGASRARLGAWSPLLKSP